MRGQAWPKIERTFHDVKPIFAEYNKWDDYGIALPFKDLDLHYNERVIDFNGTCIPWYGSMAAALERNITPRCLRSWEGKQFLTYTTCDKAETVLHGTSTLSKKLFYVLEGLHLSILGLGLHRR
jgi:hypothetical protein